MKPSEFLIEAKSLIDTPKKWTQRASARDSNGIPISVGYRDAVCFCSLGAVDKVTQDHRDAYKASIQGETFLRLALDDPRVPNFRAHHGVASFNDNSLHRDVMKMWDVAIELAQRNEA